MSADEVSPEELSIHSATTFFDFKNHILTILVLKYILCRIYKNRNVVYDSLGEMSS